MATIIDALVITLGLDPKGVSTGMQQAQGTLEGGVKSIASKVIAPLTALLAGAFAGGAIIQRFVDAAELGKLSQQLRVGVEDLQAWQGAAVRAGGSAEGLLESAKALQETTGSRLPITDQLLRMSDQLRGLNETRAMEWGKKMGLDEGTVKLLRQGRQAVQDLVNQQRELVAFTARDVEAVQSIKKGYEAFKSVIFSVGNVVTKLFLPPLRAVAERMRAAGGVVPWVTERLGGISKWISQNGPQIQNAFTAIAAVITLRMVPALLRMAASAVAAMLPFLPFILLVGGLALLFDDLMTYINGGESALEGFWAVFGTGPELAAKLGAAWEHLKAVGIALWEGIKAAAVTFFGYFAPAIEGVKTIFSGLGQFIVALFSGNFQAAGGAMRQVFDGVIAYIKGIFTGLMNFLTDAIKGLMGMLPSLNDAKTMASGAMDSIGAAAKGFWDGMTGGSKDAVRPEAARAGGSNVQAETNIGQLVVQTQATDAEGIARDAAGATRNAFNGSGALVGAANSGVAQK